MPDITCFIESSKTVFGTVLNAALKESSSCLANAASAEKVFTSSIVLISPELESPAAEATATSKSNAESVFSDTFFKKVKTAVVSIIPCFKLLIASS